MVHKVGEPFEVLGEPARWGTGAFVPEFRGDRNRPYRLDRDVEVASGTLDVLAVDGVCRVRDMDLV